MPCRGVVRGSRAEQVLSEEHHVLDHMLTGAPMPKEEEEDEERQQDKVEVGAPEHPLKTRQQSHAQQQQQQQQQIVRSKAPLPPNKRHAASKQRHVSPQQRARPRDPSPQNQLIANIGSNYHRRSPSPAADDVFGDAIIDIHEAPVDAAPSGQVVPRYLANQMAAAGGLKHAKPRAARSISPSIDFRFEAASGSSVLWEQGVGTRVLLGDVKMGNFVDIMEMDLVPVGNVKVPTKSFSQVQVRLIDKHSSLPLLLIA